MKLLKYLERKIDRKTFETLVLIHIRNVWEPIGVSDYSDNHISYRLMDTFSGREIILIIDFAKDGNPREANPNEMYVRRDPDTLLVLAKSLLHIIGTTPASVKELQTNIISRYSEELEAIEVSALVDFSDRLTDEAVSQHKSQMKRNEQFFAAVKGRTIELLIERGLIKNSDDWKKNDKIIFCNGKTLMIQWVNATRAIIMINGPYSSVNNIPMNISPEQISTALVEAIVEFNNQQ